MRFKNLVVPFLLVAFLLTGGTAMADQWPMPPFTEDHSDVELVGFMEFITTGAVGNNLFDSDDLFHSIQSVSGINYVTVIGGEAGHLNVFEVGGDTKFDNREPSNFADWIAVDFDTQEATFKDTNTQMTVSAEDTNDNLGLELWALDTDVTLAYLNNLFLPTGTVIAGFNDDFADDNHDDMIMAYSSSQSPNQPLCFFSPLA